MNKREILNQLALEAVRDGLDFQTHAAVAMQVCRALEDADISVVAVTKLIQAEPVLAARVVAVANSAALDRSGRVIADLRSAISRIGFRNVRSLAVAFLMRQMAGGKSPENSTQRRMAEKLWEHTAHVSALAQVLARRVTLVDPDTALFAAIVHEVGGFYALSRASDFPGLLDGDSTEWNEPEVLDMEISLGRAVLRALAIPESTLAILEDYWVGFLALPPRTLADTLLLAEDLAPVTSPFHEVPNVTGNDIDSADVGAAASIEMILGAKTLSEILNESAVEVNSLVVALQK